MTPEQKKRANDIVSLLNHPAFAGHLDRHHISYADALLLLESQWDDFCGGVGVYDPNREIYGVQEINRI